MTAYDLINTRRFTSDEYQELQQLGTPAAGSSSSWA